MSEATESLRRKIGSAGELQAVVRTMKALAAASIGQYEQSVRALTDYYRTVELGLGACFRESGPPAHAARPDRSARELAGNAIVFGTDQGLVGQFNDVVAAYAQKVLEPNHHRCRVWAVGERVYARLAESGRPPAGLFKVPNSVQGITPLVGRIQIECEAQPDGDASAPLWVFHNRPLSGSLYEPVTLRLLPLDAEWQRGLAAQRWPVVTLPEVLDLGSATLSAFVREYLFIGLFRACAESLTSENAARLAAMQRAEENIDELLSNLRGELQLTRQSGIDEELFDVVSGFEAQGGSR